MAKYITKDVYIVEYSDEHGHKHYEVTDSYTHAGQISGKHAVKRNPTVQNPNPHQGNPDIFNAVYHELVN